MASLKDTTITGGLSVSNTVNITGATQHNADVTLYSSSGDSPSIIFQRGTYADNLNDYKIIDTSGYLTVKQQGNSNTSGFTQVAQLTNQGTFTVSTPPTSDTSPSVTAWISPTDSAIKISTDATIANGDKLVIRDSSDSNKLRSSSITFGTSTTTYLRNDGTWAEAGGGTLLALRYTSVNSVYTFYITLASATANISNALSYNQLVNYLSAGGVSFVPGYGTPYYGGSTYATINLIGLDNDGSQPTAFLEIEGGEDYEQRISTQYVRLIASNTTTGMSSPQSTAWVTSSYGMTVAQLTAGTDTRCRPVTAKVIHDYIASLDATNVAY